jgi:hypothetical protein
MGTYKSANRHTRCDGGNGSSARIARDASSGGEGAEDETDGIEVSGLGSWS